MYQQDQTRPGQTAVPGSILVVVHDFKARSPDELSLSKNDQIELLERDDEFGDGWYLGRHLGNDQTGLFPEGTKTHATSLQVSINPAAATQGTGYSHMRDGDSSLRNTKIAQRPTVHRLPSAPTNIYSHLRQNAFIRDDTSGRHPAEIDRFGAGSTLAFPLPPNNIPSQVEGGTPLYEQERIATRQHSEIASSSEGDNQTLSPGTIPLRSQQKGGLSCMWEDISGRQEEDGSQGVVYTQHISTPVTSSPVKQGAVLSRERDEISSRVQAELVRRITAGAEASLPPASTFAEKRVATRRGAMDNLSGCVKAEVGYRIATGTVAYYQHTTEPREQTTVFSGVLEEVSGCVQTEPDQRATANTEAILQFDIPLHDKATVYSQSLEDVVKSQRGGVGLSDAPAALCPLPLFATPAQERHKATLPCAVGDTISHQRKPFKQVAALNMAPNIAPSVDVVHPPSPSISFKSESTEISNHFDLEDYLTCVYTTTAPQGTPATPTTPAQEPPRSEVQVVSMSSTEPSGVEEPRAASPTIPLESTPQISQSDRNSNRYEVAANTHPTLSSPTTPTSIPSTALRNINIATGGQHARSEESPVMNETLSVIDEHITDMSTPRHSVVAANRKGANDSGSEYSSHAERRPSYITGELTDDEEHSTYTEAQVLQWSPTDVAAYLNDVGVESHHCTVFQEQEISGEVLLGMSQGDLFIEAFDLGLLGRRLRTWHKIRALQDEVKGSRSTSRTADSYYGTDSAGADDIGRARNSTIGAVLPRIPSLMERPGSRQQHDRLSVRQASQPQQLGGYSLSPPALTPTSSQDSPTKPSTTSVRDSNHKRRHSSIEVRTVSSTNGKNDGDFEVTTPTKTPTMPHKKEPSFDRSWTMGEPATTLNGRPSTSASGREFIGGHKLLTSFDRNGFDNHPRDSGYTTLGPKDLDRGYFSGGELDNLRTRATLKKRESGSHSRKSSYADDQRVRSAISHSRYSSAGSIRELGFASITLPSASQIYHGKSLNNRLRSPAKSSIFTSTRALKDPTSPTVTKLDNGLTVGLVSLGPDTDASSSGRASPHPHPTRPVSASKSKKHATSGLRAISDAVTGSEKARLESPAPKLSATTESPVRSPTGTGSSTPSGSKSFDSDPSDGRKPANGTGRARTSSGTTRRKSKKDTSAYREGLEVKTPQEAIKNCDYSGWMKKKSSKLIAVWNQRLFVLKGTRLAYYYSENDQREKGVIDIAFHRVLTAENDRITGLHATLTGVTASPTSPQGAMTPTSASTDAASEPELTPRKIGNDSVFIFKLVPPRAGLSKAVTFTMPKVHYFAVDNIKQGRLWMAALMKATIDRDDTSPITSTYQLKTISLTKARATRQRPPALMGPDEKVDEEPSLSGSIDEGLNITGIIFDTDADVDSEIGMAKTKGDTRKAGNFDEGKTNAST
ncbi:MAG: polar growth protein [Geoglossum umbratile]|nr:MAG: polar growth protein [Geoglossum umbratile]